VTTMMLRTMMMMLRLMTTRTEWIADADRMVAYVHVLCKLIWTGQPYQIL
jgi:hypothetical protein